MQIKTVVILAAGEGSRLKHRGGSKPLIPILGIPLLERSICTLIAAGICHIVVVCGHRADDVAALAGELGCRLNIDIQTVHHVNWRKGNGSSALAARSMVNGSFILTMCDHIFDPAMLSRLMQTSPPDDGLVLAVDGNLDNPLVDMEDVTRVQCKDQYITAIGKGMNVFDAFDTGAFLCTQGLFTALSEPIVVEDGSLSAAVTWLAAANKATTLDVSGSFWIDVDDEAALLRAEDALMFLEDS